MTGFLSENLGCTTEIFLSIGVVCAAYIGLKVTLSLLCGLWTFMFGSTKNLARLGEWAAVTGATDGIGKAYAQQLAQQGLNIVLISRSPEKLEDVAREIESQYKVKTKVVAVDFTGGIEIYDKIESAIEGLQIGTLVNNVGMSYEHPQYFTEVTKERLQNIINCNINSMTMMTRMCLPQMAERKKGAIINVSSASGALPTPMLSCYSASKAYVDFLSRALQVEYKSKGLIIQSVKPYFVATKMSRIRSTSLLTPSPKQYVQQALKAVGKQTHTFGCWAHALQGYIVTRLPRCIVDHITMNQMKAVRAKALKRAQKSQ